MELKKREQRVYKSIYKSNNFISLLVLRGLSLIPKVFKPPPFWKKDPELWFAQLESLFYRSNVSSDTAKFHCIVSSIESEILSTVGDLVKKPPDTDKYLTIKKRLVTHFEDTKQQRLRKFLSDLELGNKKPSFLLMEIPPLKSPSPSFPTSPSFKNE